MRLPSTSPSKALTSLTAVICLIVSVSIPAVYFVIAYQYTGGAIDAEISLSARTVEGLIANNPNTWQFEEARLREVLLRRLDHKGPEIRTIRDAKGNVIARVGSPLARPVVTYSQTIHDSGTEVAYIDVARSLTPLVARTALVGSCSVLTGIAIFLLFLFFPLKAMREAYYAREEHERRLGLALKSGRLGVWEWDLDRNLMTWDDRMYEIFGIQKDPSGVTIDAWRNRIHPEDRERVLEEMQARIFDAEGYHGEFRILRPDGTERYVRTDGMAVKDGAGEPVRMIGVNHDVTGRRLAENSVKSLLVEKELLLREVHHRIKNNMNNIMALLSLHSAVLKDPAASSSLEDAKSRVQSMMVLYDKLYRSADFRVVSTRDYLTSLVSEIAANFPNRGRVSIEPGIEDFTLDAKVLSPLGMILNELLTNALKHAFTGREEGRIGISISAKDTRVTFVVKDDGIGLPGSVDMEDPEGFGLQLVSILTDQLDGTLRVERIGGTAFILEFDAGNV